MSVPSNTVCTIIPAMHYRDAPAAIDWLCNAFGFERHLVVPSDDGGIAHAELRFGNGMVMLGSVNDGEWSKNVVQPDECGGRGTHSLCAIVADPDAHHARAVTAGARIVLPLRDNDYGGRSYSCRDPEDHIWTFGSYDPWRA